MGFRFEMGLFGVNRTRRIIDRDRERAWYPELYGLLAEAGLKRGPVYIRFGLPPKNGQSWKYDWGKREEGVSAYRARETLEGHFLLNIPGGWRARAVLYSLCQDEHRPAYLVEGRVVGTGNDGEPVLGDITRVEAIPDKAIVAIDPPSAALEMWNVAQGGWLDERPPLGESPSARARGDPGQHELLDPDQLHTTTKGDEEE